LREKQGRVVILGSGFGELSLYAAELYAQGILSQPPVIVDLFDYEAAKDDLSILQEKFSERRLLFPFSTQLSRATDTVNATNSGNLDSITYLVGSGNPPSQLTDASVVDEYVWPSR